jgi:trk system potassium uptake protein
VVTAAAIIILVTSLLFLRHFLATTLGPYPPVPGDAAKALWGGFFTTLSFLTTTGFESRGWLTTTDWSGLSSPGLILLGLSIIGGGVCVGRAPISPGSVFCCSPCRSSA